MPLIEASFVNGSDGTANGELLLNYGPTIEVIVGPFKQAEKSPQDKIDDSKIKQVYALVDTGASNCMIDSNLAVELGLIAVDKAMVSGVGGQREHLIYMAGIVIPQLEIDQFGPFLAADLKDGGQEHEVLLGRDFLKNTIMIYDGLRAQVTITSRKK